MKLLAVLAALLSTSHAVQTKPPAIDEAPSCPANFAQPDGKLPEDAISTSLLLPISAKAPNKSFYVPEWAKVTPNDECTIFNLELPVAASQGKICNLVFDFPSYDQAPGVPYVFHGPGHFTFTGYEFGAGAIPGVTTFENQPEPGLSPPNPPEVVEPGNSYVIHSAPCDIPPEMEGAVLFSGSLCSEDTTFMFKQSNEQGCPLGFYVVLTDDPDAGEDNETTQEG
ncbi:hypothetical protein M011DRAFT_520795 [Sporormia fimetaria CBS 119925]|uniref:Ubiquitin 3 binding protein But2 C-terminal domain-containing protein n=1 Tax=Sporormia fimetaria CBS 119925 TaxID=1340428 RepID=A0A6A6V5K2_9PLEO|nr:hypothetical protein M011DRAFT_520795 [Sporormia fimetaria CBS 119925]